MMRSVPLFATASVLIAAGWFLFAALDRGSSDEIFEASQRPPDPAPLCPWREPERDLELFFSPSATCRTETRVLSGARLELSQQLGRPLLPEEMALQVHHVLDAGEPAGEVLIRRAKGEHGAIELVIACNPDGSIRGVRLQRCREPEEISEALHSTNWLASFSGKCASSTWDTDALLEPLPAAAHAAAREIVDGVRSAIILLQRRDALAHH